MRGKSEHQKNKQNTIKAHRGQILGLYFFQIMQLTDACTLKY